MMKNIDPPFLLSVKNYIHIILDMMRDTSEMGYSNGAGSCLPSF